MTKRISSKWVDVRTQAIYELDALIAFMRSIDPDLTVDEATVLAAIALDNLPMLYLENPPLVETLRKAAVTIKRKARRSGL